MRTRPHNLVYGVDDRPPALILIVQGLQHVSIASVSLLLPLIVARAAGLAEESLPSLMSFCMLAIALATLLQAWPMRGLGAGYLIPGFCSANYLSCSVAAAQAGGLPLVYGMTLMAGAFEATLSRAITRLRPYLPPELSGVAILIIGLDQGVIAFRNISAPDPSGHAPSLVAAVSFATFALAFALSIYGKGPLRLFCSLIAVVAGYAVAVLVGLMPERGMTLLSRAAAFDLPDINHIGFSFDPYFIVPFLLASLAAMLKTVGAVTTCQKINDADWKRPDMVEIQRGVASDGVATVAAALMGATGQNSSTANIGVANATGATSRWIAVPVAAWLVVMACSPKLAAVFVVMPAAVIGGSLMFAACFMLVNGLQIVTSRMLDTRRTAVVGLSLILVVTSYAFPGVYKSLPPEVHPLTNSPLSIGVLTAFVLNMILRLGVRRSDSMVCKPSEGVTGPLRDFMYRLGASWGARMQVIETASHALTEVVEALQPLAGDGTPILVTASFDEFNVVVVVSYQGKPLKLGGRIPEPEELLENPDLIFEMRGLLIARYTDRIRVTSDKSGHQVLLQFEH